MPKIHVISFTPNGSVEYTRSPDLSFLFDGQGAMERVTDIGKRPESSKYFIKWLQGPFAGKIQTYGMAARYGLMGSCSVAEIEMNFYSYEQAVAFEVQMLNAMRKAGVQFGTANE